MKRKDLVAWNKNPFHYYEIRGMWDDTIYLKYGPTEEYLSLSEQGDELIVVGYIDDNNSTVYTNNVYGNRIICL